MRNLIKILFILPLISTLSLKAAQYETDDVADIVYDLSPEEQAQLDQDLDAEPTIHENSVTSSENFRKAYNYLKRVSVIKGDGHKKTIKAVQVFQAQSKKISSASDSKAWSTEEFIFKNSAPIYVNDFLGKLQQWVNRAQVMTEEDQALNFIETENNKLEF